MLGKALIVVSLIAFLIVPPALSIERSIFISTGNTEQDGYGAAYSGFGQSEVDVPSQASSAGQTSTDSLLMYREYWDPGQGEQYASGPIQFETYGSEPSYLIIDGQSRPYDPYYVPSNSLWIQGRTSWTQYMKCPLNARFRMLAYSDGGLTTVIETYADGRQDVQQYSFYRGYTQLIFLGDEIGRHTLVFYNNGRQSNEVVVDVVPYGGPYSGYTGQPYSSSVEISIGVGGQATSQNGCGISGTWRFGTGYVIAYDDGRLEAKSSPGIITDRGTWRLEDASQRSYAFSWQSGWSHSFTLSADCSTLDGYASDGKHDSGTRVTSSGTGYSGISTGYPGFNAGQILIDSADQGFDPDAPAQGYGDPYLQPGSILIDSTEGGFDPNAPLLREPI